ncbi:hypothetical protein GPL15_22135 [Clostridium sp. MCC353]|uniref:hypothetical protein n=1 Tax=Clostridium sp. MCC353 TaxID=2592646 RepID=UPI001C03309C|nr:hypothetical protein [Clostridium sp. MCC353]MBT9779182.1 hypothetical protein [Clostridium sp. MCC353]
MLQEYIKSGTDKWKSRQGASMAIALLYFLICAMVGSVVLAAASANVSHVKMEKRNEGSYLAVMSAAELLKAQLKDCAGEWEADHDGQETAADSDNRMEFKESMLDSMLMENEGMAVKQALLQSFYQTYLNCLNDNELQVPKDLGSSEALSLTFEGADGGEMDGGSEPGAKGEGEKSGGLFGYRLPPVTVTLTVTPDHVVLSGRNSQQLHVTAVADFSIADESYGQYRMSMTMGGLIHYTLEEETESETDPDTGIKTTTYHYCSQVIISPDKPLISVGGKTGGGSK